MTRVAIALFTALSILLAGSVVRAATIVLDAIDSGFVTEAGGSSKYDGLIVAPATFNYSVGFEVHYAAGGLSIGSGLAPMFRKNYFVFDLTGVPAAITAATLVPFNAVGGYESLGLSETFVVGGTTSPGLLADLAAMASVASPAAVDAAAVSLATSIYAALATTPPFGAATLTVASDGTAVPIPLSASGVAYLNALAGGSAVLGGTLPTADPPDGVPQSVFGFGAPFFSGEPLPKLVLITAVPEPAGLLVGLVALAGLVVLRRRAPSVNL